MRVAERLAGRQAAWSELDALLTGRASGQIRGRPSAEEVLRLGELYRSVCSDLMLAEAHDLPRETVAYLHSLVARAHNAIYRSRGLGLSGWASALWHDVPRRLRADRLLWLSAALFYVPMLVFGLLAAAGSEVVGEVVNAAELRKVEEMYSTPLSGNPARNDVVMTGFYIWNNASIGLRCYAWGLAFGVGTIFVLVGNGLSLGAAFGHMAVSEHAANFYEFVTAHAPFELTAIVFSGAAGLGLGRGLIVTEGYSRLVSLRRAAKATLPTAGAAVVLFVLAAFLEGFVSASTLSHATKGGISLACAAILFAYLLLGGRSFGRAADGAIVDPAKAGRLRLAAGGA